MAIELARLYTVLQDFFGEHPFLVIFTNLFSVFFVVLLGWICFAASKGNKETQILNVLIFILGALLGWILGMFFAPYSDAEANRFASIGQALSAFVSGYIIAKLDKIIDSKINQTTPFEPSLWIRVGIFVCALLVAMVTVFSNRAYFRNTDPTKSGYTHVESRQHSSQSPEEHTPCANSSSSATAPTTT